MKANCRNALLIAAILMTSAGPGIAQGAPGRGGDTPPASGDINPEDTVEFYNSAIVREPESAVYRNNLAVLHYRAGRYDEAIATLRGAVKIDRTATSNLNLSITLETVGRHSEALASAVEAIKLEPKNKRVRQQLCGLHYLLKQFQKAVACYEVDPSIGDNDLLSQSFYAAAYLNSGDPEKAIKIAKTIISEQPLFPAAYNILGTAQFVSKKYRDAVISYRKAVEISPDVAAYRYNLGVTQMMTQNKAGALSQYKLIKGENEKLAKALYGFIFADRILIAPPPLASKKP